MQTRITAMVRWTFTARPITDEERTNHPEGIDEQNTLAVCDDDGDVLAWADDIAGAIDEINTYLTEDVGYGGTVDSITQEEIR